MKQKSKKRIFLVLAAVILIMAVLSAAVTGITAGKISHRYASAEEGRELLLANRAYYENFSQNDIDFRMAKSGATLDELLVSAGQEVRSFSFLEKLFIDSRLAKMARTLEKNGYELPPLDEIVFIKTDMETEAGASGYTHGTQIYLNSKVIMVYSLLHFVPGVGNYADELLWHELFHCLTRCNPDFRSQMYSLIHFTVTDSDFELPPGVREYYISNPDVEHHDSYATFSIDGRDIDCFAAFVTTMKYEEAQSDFFSCGTTALIPTDGTDIYYTPEQAANFDEVFGTNTGYVIDPEECMADNFMLAMLYGIDGKEQKGYPNPEIIRGIIDIVSREH